jgi:hypothetical protein
MQKTESVAVASNVVVPPFAIWVLEVNFEHVTADHDGYCSANDCEDDVVKYRYRYVLKNIDPEIIDHKWMYESMGNDVIEKTVKLDDNVPIAEHFGSLGSGYCGYSRSGLKHESIVRIRNSKIRRFLYVGSEVENEDAIVNPVENRWDEDNWEQEMSDEDSEDDSYDERWEEDIDHDSGVLRFSQTVADMFTTKNED